MEPRLLPRLPWHRGTWAPPPPEPHGLTLLSHRVPAPRDPAFLRPELLQCCSLSRQVQSFRSQFLLVFSHTSPPQTDWCVGNPTEYGDSRLCPAWACPQHHPFRGPIKLASQLSFCSRTQLSSHLFSAFPSERQSGWEDCSWLAHDYVSSV